jgi:hypothetical protein
MLLKNVSISSENFWKFMVVECFNYFEYFPNNGYLRQFSKEWKNKKVETSEK